MAPNGDGIRVRQISTNNPLIVANLERGGSSLLDPALAVLMANNPGAQGNTRWFVSGNVGVVGNDTCVTLP
jgi:hypothetical protein